MCIYQSIISVYLASTAGISSIATTVFTDRYKLMHFCHVSYYKINNEDKALQDTSKNCTAIVFRMYKCLLNYNGLHVVGQWQADVMQVIVNDKFNLCSSYE